MTTGKKSSRQVENTETLQEDVSEPPFVPEGQEEPAPPKARRKRAASPKEELPSAAKEFPATEDSEQTVATPAKPRRSIKSPGGTVKRKRLNLSETLNTVAAQLEELRGTPNEPQSSTHDQPLAPPPDVRMPAEAIPSPAPTTRKRKLAAKVAIPEAADSASAVTPAQETLTEEPAGSFAHLDEAVSASAVTPAQETLTEEHARSFAHLDEAVSAPVLTAPEESAAELAPPEETPSPPILNAAEERATHVAPPDATAPEVADKFDPPVEATKSGSATTPFELASLVPQFAATDDDESGPMTQEERVPELVAPAAVIAAPTAREERAPESVDAPRSPLIGQRSAPPIDTTKVDENVSPLAADSRPVELPAPIDVASSADLGKDAAAASAVIEVLSTDTRQPTLALPTAEAQEATPRRKTRTLAWIGAIAIVILCFAGAAVLLSRRGLLPPLPLLQPNPVATQELKQAPPPASEVSSIPAPVLDDQRALVESAAVAPEPSPLDPVAEAIRAARQPAIDACFFRARRRNPELQEASLTVEIDFFKRKKIRAVRATDTVGQPAFNRCVLVAMWKTRPPAGAEGTTVEIPFELKPPLAQ